MPTDSSNRFQSVLSTCMEKFLQEKHACGCAYQEQARILRQLDNLLVREGLATYELPAPMAQKWLAKKPHESVETQRPRFTLVRQFSRFLLRLGYSAYVEKLAPAKCAGSVQTPSEIGQIERQNIN